MKECPNCHKQNMDDQQFCKYCGASLLPDSPKYKPGYEPENIKKFLDMFFADIDTVFPDKQIFWSEWKHERWDNAANTLCKVLNYKTQRVLLAAYGYTIVKTSTKATNKKIENNIEPGTVIPQKKKNNRGSSKKGRTIFAIKASHAVLIAAIIIVSFSTLMVFHFGKETEKISSGVTLSERLPLGSNAKGEVSDSRVESVNDDTNIGIETSADFSEPQYAVSSSLPTITEPLQISETIGESISTTAESVTENNHTNSKELLNEQDNTVLVASSANQKEQRTWKIVFRDQISILQNEFLSNSNTYDLSRCEYSVYDIDFDGTPELFVYSGSCNADMRCNVYCFSEESNQAVLLDVLPLSQSGLCGTGVPNCILTHYGHQGVEKIDRVYYSNGVFTIDRVYENNLARGTDYLNLIELQRYTLDDFSGLNWLCNAAENNLNILVNAINNNQTESTASNLPFSEQENGWKTAYRRQIDTLREEVMTNGDIYTPSRCNYSLYDIDFDGTPEMVVYLCGSSADNRCNIYSYSAQSNQAVFLKLLALGHSELCSTNEPNCMLIHYGHQGREIVDMLYYYNGQFTSETVCERDIIALGEDYLDIKPIQRSALDDYSGLNWTANPVQDNLSILETAMNRLQTVETTSPSVNERQETTVAVQFPELQVGDIIQNSDLHTVTITSKYDNCYSFEISIIRATVISDLSGIVTGNRLGFISNDGKTNGYLEFDGEKYTLFFDKAGYPIGNGSIYYGFKKTGNKKVLVEENSVDLLGRWNCPTSSDFYVIIDKNENGLISGNVYTWLGAIPFSGYCDLQYGDYLNFASGMVLSYNYDDYNIDLQLHTQYVDGQISKLGIQFNVYDKQYNTVFGTTGNTYLIR